MTMKLNKIVSALLMALAGPAAMAGVYQQCPFPVPTNPAVVPDYPATGAPAVGTVYKEVDEYKLNIFSRVPAAGAPRQVCLHVVGGDGWMILGNNTQAYGFGFAPAEGQGDDVMVKGQSNAKFPAPTFTFREGDEVYVSLTNVGMLHRPDLFDTHSVHFHGYPQASAIFDGVPNGSVTVNMGSTFTYYYKIVEPGTFMWHCHVEATEHLEMGMMGMLNVRPRQDGTSIAVGGKTYSKFAYNDGDGSTGYDRVFSMQLGGVDQNFHELHELVQPLPFLELKADFTQINGRGYPMTTFEGNAGPALPGQMRRNMRKAPDSPDVTDTNSVSQPIASVVRAKTGEKVLLRITNLTVDSYYTMTALGLPLEMVGRGAHIARGPAASWNLASSDSGSTSWSYKTSAVTLGGGEGTELLVDTTGVAPGTYYIYTTNLNLLSNGPNEDRGGLMTTFVVTE
jgi:FtsP/CotA-like multicopper oxidase with cupredoxin domain